MSVSINVKDVVKKYGDVTIIPDLSTTIKNGEFFTLLGPSGCGKTTLLRMIAGFNSIEGGTIAFDDKVINDTPAQNRNIGMVFQSYAIFPHLTVRQNVEYGLKIRKVPKTEMKQRVDEILKIVKIEEYQDRLPERLSGGQQQRVALARAIVIHPQVLLMDEPLSNLDAKLRIEMRSAIRDVQKQIGITTVYVTHDQEEALAISDRIAVMKDGIIRQIGSPQDIYARPYDAFVSTFIGHSNLFHGTLKRADGGYNVVFNNGFSIFMDNISSEASETGIDCKILSRVFLGKYTNYFLEFAPGMVLDDQPSIEYSQDLGQAERIFDEGESIKLLPNKKKINIFTKDMEKSLIKDVVKYAE